MLESIYFKGIVHPEHTSVGKSRHYRVYDTLHLSEQGIQVDKRTGGVPYTWFMHVDNSINHSSSMHGSVGGAKYLSGEEGRAAYKIKDEE
jgi:hypothetical protein